ncbi:hypothetical protein MCOR25_009109 [Pyricularia grisea]|nr:hypothetical protein MCOR25_009109 [Pyricularia grisea]
MMFRLKMELIASAAVLSSIASGLDVNVARSLSGVCPRDTEYAKLGCSLSPESKMYFPGSAEFTAASTRWSNLAPPTVDVVVVPATEDDVSKTVKYANKNKKPFLAYNTVHGSLTTLGRMNGGIEIFLNQLNGIEIAPDGQTAKLGGGVRSKDVTNTLFAAGKQTVTGTCECVSMMGPALGGGHGWLQGHYGLVADNIISFNVVLADGSRVTVDKSSDLFYALKGAGHNFGIVTSIVAKIYDVTQPNWAINTMVFSGDKVEAVYAAANEHFVKNGKQDTALINWSYWLNSADLDPNNPIIIFYIIQEGVDVVDKAYTDPFTAIGPMVSTPESGNYTQVSGWAGVADTAPPCQKDGKANPRFPIYQERYNATAMRQAYNLYASQVGPADSPFHGSIFMFEGYSGQGMRAVPSDSTAFAHRSENLLNAPLIQYQPGSAELDARAEKLGNDLRQILQDGTGRTGLPPAYVNYGYGTEQQTQFYGAQPGRIEKLCKLKKKYDPNGRFNFYAPLQCGKGAY